MEKDNFKIFLEVLKECNIQTGQDFAHFMSVIQEHCLNKGITDYNQIKKVWSSHKNSLYNIIDHLKNYSREEERRA